MITRPVRLLRVVALTTVSAAAAAQSATDAAATAPVQVRSMAATCAACHGTDGHAVAGESMVALAGYPRDALATQMRAFRDGTRPATVMQQIARGYTDAQVDALAAYFAARPAGPR